MKALYFLLFFPLLSEAQDFSLFEKKNFNDADGSSLPYRILYPAEYDQTKDYPLVLLLHGGGERGVDNEKQLTHVASIFLSPENRSKFPCIVVVPQCPEDQYWASVKFDRKVYPLVLDFNYEYPITNALKMAVGLVSGMAQGAGVDKRRVYIMGLSMGGMGTLEAVYRYPGLFAAAVAICGGADTKAYSKKQAKIPFWLFHGDADAVIGVEHSREMVARLKALKAQVKYTEYPGVNHNSWENAAAEPDLLPWLFSQHR